MKLPVIVIATPHQRNDELELNLRKNLPQYRLVRVRSNEQLNLSVIASLNPDYIFFPHWSWFISEQIFSRYRCVVFHMTDLPYGRGGSPLQNLIVRGHSETMLAALKCVKELDAGPVYLKRQMSLDGTAEQILRRASELMIDMATEIVTKDVVPIEQCGEIVHFARRKREDGDLAHAGSIKQAFDTIRMLDADGYPSAFLETKDLKFDLKDANNAGEYLEARVIITRKV